VRSGCVRQPPRQREWNYAPLVWGTGMQLKNSYTLIRKKRE
jgi:hypothetical protein